MRSARPAPNLKQEVTAALKETGLKVEVDEDKLVWRMGFTINAIDHPTLLMVLSGSNHFWAVAPIISDRLRAPFSSLSAEVLRAILRAQAEMELAKFHIVNEADAVYAAISLCSKDQWTGDKLFMRLYRCAELAAKIRAVLLEIPRSDPAAG